MKESMVIYRSFYEALKDLPETNRLQVWDAICELGLNGVEVELTGLSKTIFTLIKPQIDANNRRAAAGKEHGHLGGEYGKLGGRPPKEKPSNNPQQNPQETPSKPSNVNDNANENENGNVNDNSNSIVSKETKPKSFKTWTYDQFNNSIAEHKELFERSLLLDFQKYWTEPSPSGKLRFQLEKTWDTLRRLERWKANNFKKAPIKPEPIQFNRSSANHYV